MAFNARIYGYRGIVQVQQRMVKQFNSDSVFLLDDPYEWAQKLTTNGAMPVASVVQAAPDQATILYIQVADGQQIRYEVNPNGPLASNARVAGDLSPRISGFSQIPWGPGYTLSIVDAASFP